jgi:hypothetical protein
MTDAKKAENTLRRRQSMENHNSQCINQIWICGNHNVGQSRFGRYVSPELVPAAMASRLPDDSGNVCTDRAPPRHGL